MRVALRRKRLLLSSVLSGALLLTISGAAFAQSDAVYQFDIPAESLSQALKDLGQTTSQQLIFSEDLVRGRKTVGLHGKYTTTQALRLLLADTSLVAETSSTGVIMVESKNAEAVPDKGAANSGTSTVETVVVTAEKQTESSLNVPIALTTLSGESLARTSSFRLDDLVGKIPGLTLTTFSAGQTVLTIRGLTTGVDIQGGTAVYLDEAPYTPSSVGAGRDFVNLDTYDLSRIEVLKGPQGTLYGANAASGLFKYVTNAPDASAFSATVQAGMSSVYNGGLGFDLHGMVNVPLTDDLALRLVAYDNFYPGYTNDPSRGAKGINDSRISGGRGSLLWQPSQDFSVRFDALYQKRTTGDYLYGSEDVQPYTFKPIYGTLNQHTLIPQPADASTYLASVTVNWDMGFANLVSISSVHHGSLLDQDDDTGFFAIFNSFNFWVVPAGMDLVGLTRYTALSQEVRLSSQEAGPLQWKVGGFFTQQSSLSVAADCPIILSTDQVDCGLLSAPAFGSMPGGSADTTVTYREYAAFANLDYFLTPDLDLSLGGRDSYIEQWWGNFSSGSLFGVTDERKKSYENVPIWSADLRWHFDPQNMVYARAGTGYEPGGPNAVTVVKFPGEPTSYQSSTTTNYEVGLKSAWLDDRLTAEFALYRVDWHKIILFIDNTAQNQFYVTNAGTAHSNGFEWQFNFVPVEGLTLGWNGNFNDSTLTKVSPDFAATYGAGAGSRLPFVPFWQTSLSADYERSLFGDYSGFVGVSERFTGSRPGYFNSGGPREDFPSYGIFDLRAGVESDRYSFTLYVKNLGNTIAPTSDTAIDPGPAGPNHATVTQPRLVGATLAAKF